MAISIRGAVGASSTKVKAPNNPDDVLKIKKLLNQAGAKPRLLENSTCDAGTIKAIESYQKGFMKTPDGRVDPNGNTLKKLNGGAPKPLGRTIRKLVVHHTAGSKDSTVEKIRDYHVRVKGWKDIGYHQVIYGNGSLHAGRPEKQIGAHTKGQNTDSLGVSMCGNFENELPEQGQVNMLILLLTRWCRDYGVDPTQIYGHRDFSSTACPGKNFYPRLSEVRSSVQAQLAAEKAAQKCLANLVKPVTV